MSVDAQKFKEAFEKAQADNKALFELLKSKDAKEDEADDDAEGGDDDAKEES